MKQRLQKILNYALFQLTQASTLRGLVLLVTAVGVKLEPQMVEAIVSTGLGVAGLIGILLPDHLRKGKAISDEIRKGQ
jgi:hypothetical protein